MSKVIFRASIPLIQSAIKVGSDGARLQLDVPESDVLQMLELLEIKNKPLLVEITPLTDESAEY